MKRSKEWRIEQEKRIIHNRLDLIKQLNPDFAKEFEDEQHKLAKQHPLDCGNSKCKICHPGKNYEDGNHKDYHYYKDHPEELENDLDEDIESE